MKLIIENGNLFDVDYNNKYYLVHCISADCKMGAGIAVEFNRKFKLKEKIGYVKVGEARQIERVFNLITKENYFDKPNFFDFIDTLVALRVACLQSEIKYLAMPKIGCGLDGLDWGKVVQSIELAFKDIDIEILVRYL